MGGAHLLAAAAALSLTASAGPAEQLAGRYGRHFINGMVHGPAIAVDDVIEIVPVSDRAAYVRLELNFFNGHICTLSGVAEEEDGALVYREPLEQDQPRRCTLRIARQGRQLRLSDGGGSCSIYCGARGSLQDAALPWSSRRRITYMDRLRGSEAYRIALEEWRTGRRVLP